MKMYYVVNARLPNKKAYGIQIAKMCEAFIENGVDLELVIPRTRAARAASLRQFYDLRIDVPTTTLPTLDLYDKGRIGYAVSSLMFSFGLALFFIRRRLRGERGIYYSIPDVFSYTTARMCGLSCAVEIHEPWQLTRLMRNAKTVIATNGETARAIEKKGIAADRVLIEPNGVDLSAYTHMPTKEAARETLGVLSNAKVALYVGRLYAWKGLEILVEAAQRESHIAWYVVGGSAEEFKKATGIENISSNMRIVGEVSPTEVPTWEAAADVLLALGTQKNEISYRYTAPMKLYEYMSASRPVVVSATPAMKSLVDERSVYFYEPDDAEELVRAVQKALLSGVPRASAEEANQHTWQKRAERITAELLKL